MYKMLKKNIQFQISCSFLPGLKELVINVSFPYLFIPFFAKERSLNVNNIFITQEVIKCQIFRFYDCYTCQYRLKST